MSWERNPRTGSTRDCLLSSFRLSRVLIGQKTITFSTTPADWLGKSEKPHIHSLDYTCYNVILALRVTSLSKQCFPGFARNQD